MIVYSLQDRVPLSYTKIVNNAFVSGLTVSVRVLNVDTGAVLLASTTLPEVAAGVGIYNMEWAHGLNADTPCIAQYSVSGSLFVEYFFITYNSASSAR